jgi:alpha 1,2-mannosyltransferase
MHSIPQLNSIYLFGRWGDAPVHSIAAALLLRKDEVHWFYDHGYFHNPFRQCPREPAWVADEKCLCDPEDSFGKTRVQASPIHSTQKVNLVHPINFPLDEHWYSCTPQWLELTGKKRTDYLMTTR